MQFGEVADWASRHPWALARRADILQYIDDEPVRQKAPGSLAEIDQEAGTILLRRSGTAGAPASLPRDRVQVSRPSRAAVPPETRAAGARWVSRLTTLRMYLGLIVLAGALLVGGGLWLRNALFSIDPGQGTALGYSVRTDRHVATLIQTREPSVPTLGRNLGNDRYSVSLFLVPLDGSATRLIPLRSGLAPDGFALARVLGSGGRTPWFDVAGTGGVDLDDCALRSEAEVTAVDPRSLPRPRRDSPLPPTPEQLLARVDDTGRKALWRVDTGIGRFALQQIPPGARMTACSGTRPPVADKVSEPLLVIVEHESGRQAAHSLWQ